MNQHRKTFEDVYSSDKKSSRSRLDFDKISIADGITIDKYAADFKAFLKKAFSSEFDNYVRLSWLRRKFCYNGKKTKMPMNTNSWALNMAFVKFMRRCIGKDIQIITKGRFFSKIELYFEEFFPGFMDGNPFTNPEYYKFPYENISMEYLTVVYDLNDRIELLNIAEERNMSYCAFMDYVLNHIHSENLRIKRRRYYAKQNQDRDFTFCVRDGDKDYKRLNKKK